MKRNKLELKLTRRLVLVRTTIRELTATQLQHVNGGDYTDDDYTSGDYTTGLITAYCTEVNCCGNPYTIEG